MKNKWQIFKKNFKKEFFMQKEILEQKAVFKTLIDKFFNSELQIDTKEFPIKNWKRIVICAATAMTSLYFWVHSSQEVHRKAA